MADHAAFVGPTRLCDLALPGTHDSATADITAGSPIDPNGEFGGVTFVQYMPYAAPSATNVMANWSRNQAFDIAAQLNAGIRYLDLRICDKDGQHWTEHSLFGTSLATVLQQVSQFLAANPREIVLLDINHIYGITDYSALAQYVLSGLGAKVAPGNRYTPQSKVEDLWSANVQAIVLFANANAVTAHPELWSQDQICSWWPKTAIWGHFAPASTAI